MPQPPDGSGPLSPERPELLEMIAQATSMDSPTMLLDLASSLLAANEIAQQQSPDVASIQELGIEMLDNVAAETEPLLRIWAEMLGDEIFRRRVHRDLSATGSNSLPEWIHRADQIRPRRASAVISEVRIEETIFLEISTAGGPTTLATAVERSGSPFLEDAYLIDDSIDSVLADVASNPEFTGDRVDLSLADAAARLSEAFDMGEHMYPPSETETWPGMRGLLEWMLRLLPAGGTGFDFRMWEPEDISEIVEDFLRSPHAAKLSEQEAEHAHQLFELQANYGNNDPLRWSGSFVTRLMCELYPRKNIAPDDYMLLMPTTLSALVVYANERSGIDDVFTDNCLAAIEANRSRYEELVTGERRDDSPFPGAGPDEYLSELLTDLEDPESMIGRLLLDACAEAAGSYDALRSLDTEPLPSEGLETTGVADDIIGRLRSLETAILQASDELFGEPELATVTLRLLTEIARADPEIFRRRFADRTVIAALFWITAKNNDLFPRSGGNPTAMTIGRLQKRLGVSTSPKAKAATLLKAIGYDLNDFSEVVLGDPRYLISSYRRKIITTRDEFSEHMPD
ncbi:hypothetical protein [Brevibacterium sp. SMBL_HHYL_HB1]|uniref:hypothetical protein n=1 Tax=Brevibacterium sp. SMBL_HHYL_HB1 TaxID=2777556 RepID=UPI001BAB3F35|nr:hypothetical protein [Brevibacterium sp. SMBL_HHYL_HB1]QUL78805.1 hypothetical protein IG171_15725 [Brevibacterium sp. SMBL_HHYL_HB1]